MTKVVFDTCCGCIELRTGCLIIAYLNLVAEIVLIGVGIAGVTVGWKDSDSEDIQEASTGTAMFVVSVVLLIVIFFVLAFTIVLLVGLHKYKRGHIKAYLIYGVIFLVINIFSFFVGSITAIVQGVPTIIVNWYFLMVIRSYYYKMDEKRPAVYSAA